MVLGFWECSCGCTPRWRRAHAEAVTRGVCALSCTGPPLPLPARCPGSLSLTKTAPGCATTCCVPGSGCRWAVGCGLGSSSSSVFRPRAKSIEWPSRLNGGVKTVVCTAPRMMTPAGSWPTAAQLPACGLRYAAVKHTPFPFRASLRHRSRCCGPRRRAPVPANPLARPPAG